MTANCHSVREVPMPSVTSPLQPRSLARSLHRLGKGFTLIELMITVAIVAILASIAYPSYTAYVRRGKIPEAIGKLATLRVNLEQYYQDHKNYGTTATTCPTEVPMPPVDSFTLSCKQNTAGGSQGFLVTATGTGLMVDYEYTIDEQNHQVTTKFPGATVPTTCWLKKAGASC